MLKSSEKSTLDATDIWHAWREVELDWVRQSGPVCDSVPKGASYGVDSDCDNFSKLWLLLLSVN